MSSSKVSIDQLPEGDVRVEVRSGRFLVAWVLREVGVGANDWRPIGFTTRTTKRGDELSPSDLRGLPIASTLRQAQATARTRGARRRLAALTDPPAVWREDGRGRGRRRSLRDYAELASSYASGEDEKRRRGLPQLWSAQFGGSPKTWQNRLTEARNRGLLDAQGQLTIFGEQTLYCDGLQIEQQVYEAERRAVGEWTDEVRARDRLAGMSERSRLKDDDQLLKSYYKDDHSEDG